MARDFYNYVDKFLNDIQKTKMKELWDNKEDEVWDRRVHRKSIKK